MEAWIRMIVCHCRGVSDRTVKRAVRAGAACVSAVGRACGAGTGCGGCHGTIEEILAVERIVPDASLEILSLSDAITAA